MNINPWFLVKGLALSFGQCIGPPDSTVTPVLCVSANQPLQIVESPYTGGGVTLLPPSARTTHPPSWVIPVRRLPSHYLSVPVGSGGHPRHSLASVPPAALPLHPSHLPALDALPVLPSLLQRHEGHAALPSGRAGLERHRIQVQPSFIVDRKHVWNRLVNIE